MSRGDKLPAASAATASMTFRPGRSKASVTQFVVPLADLAIASFTLTRTSTTPDELGAGSKAVPVMETTLLLTETPLEGLAMKTLGGLLSSCPPGATRSRMEPRELVSALATAIKYPKPAWVLKVKKA